MLGAELLEELLRVGTARLREQDFPAQLRQKLAELLGVARFVEQVGAEDEIPRRGAQQGFRFAPANPGHPEEEAVALGVLPEQLDRVLRPVRREHLGAAKRRRERRQPKPTAELEHPARAQLEARDMAGKRDSARPELGPVRQELLLVERRLVDQLLCTRRPEDRQPKAGAELDLLLD